MLLILLLNNFVIEGDEYLPDMSTDEFCIRDGVVMVKKGAVIPEGVRIM